MPYSAKLLREVLDAQLEMVCRFARDGTILFVNRAYAEPLGLIPEDLRGRSLWDFVTGDDRLHVEREMAKLRPDNRLVMVENRFETEEGTRWTLWRNVGLVFDEAGNWLEAQSIGFDVTERKRLEQQRELLIAELNHRVRNTLMVVQGIAWQTFKSADVRADRLEVFNARLHALAAAHGALSRSNWTGADLAGLAEQVIAASGAETERVAVEGPEVMLPPGAVVALVLVLHELATNAIKYGALSNGSGKVVLGWEIGDDAPEGRRITLEWRESGGPAPAAGKGGFGTRLITTSIRQQLGGEVTLDPAAEGMRCQMAFALSEAA